jgi:virginiamycin B lyase
MRNIPIGPTAQPDARRGGAPRERVHAASRRVRDRKRRPALEPLEERQLLSVTFTTFSNGIPAGATPTGITVGPDGNLWFTEPGSNQIGRITTAGAVTQFSGLPANSGASGITAGPSGSNQLYFTETNLNQIGAINLQTGAISQFSNGIPAGANPTNITLGPDGNLWFTEPGPGGQAIGRLNPTTGVISQFFNGIPAGANPYDIVTGPDGNLWFTEPGTSQIGRITTSGVVTQFSTGLAAGADPTSIAPGPNVTVNGQTYLTLWFTEQTANRVGQITIPQTNLNNVTLREFTTGLPTTFQPAYITAGPQSSMWFTSGVSATGAPAFQGLGQVTVGQVAGAATTTTPAGQISTYADGPAYQITLGPDGNLWFTQPTAGVIGAAVVSTTSGVTPPLVPPPPPAPPSGPAPVVTRLNRIGLHQQPPRIVLAFSAAMNPGTVQNINNYIITGLNGRRVGIEGVLYDASNRTATLFTQRPISLYLPYRLTVIGTGPTGVAAATGQLLDGNGNGQPGSNFVGIVLGFDQRAAHTRLGALGSARVAQATAAPAPGPVRRPRWTPWQRP